MQAPARLLLQRRGHKRRIRLAGIGLVFYPGHGHARALQGLFQGLRLRLGDDDNVLGLHVSAIVEIAAHSHALAIDRGQARVKGRRALAATGAGARVQGGEQIPVISGDKRHAFALTLDDDPRGHRLHAPGRKPRHNLLPQHRGDFVAVEAVEDATGFLGIDKVIVQVAGVFRRLQNCGLGDLIKDHAAHRHLGL